MTMRTSILEWSLEATAKLRQILSTFLCPTSWLQPWTRCPSTPSPAAASRGTWRCCYHLTHRQTPTSGKLRALLCLQALGCVSTGTLWIRQVHFTIMGTQYLVVLRFDLISGLKGHWASTTSAIQALCGVQSGEHIKTTCRRSNTEYGIWDLTRKNLWDLFWDQKCGTWKQNQDFLGQFWLFGPRWNQVPNSGLYNSACTWESTKNMKLFSQAIFMTFI